MVNMEQIAALAPYGVAALAVALALLALGAHGRRTRELAAVRGELTGWATALRAAEAGEADARVEVAALRERAARIPALAARIEAQEDELYDQRAAAERARRKVAELETAQARDAAAHAGQVAQLQAMRADIDQRFEALAQQALERSGDALARSSDARLSGLIVPLKEQITRFETELRGVHDGASKDRARLQSEIEHLTRRSAEISHEAVRLTRALKGDSQVQGAWGEMILTGLLERSGLRAGEEYVVQAHRVTEDGARLRPDVVINLPGGKTLVIDSKVSLTAYERAINAEDGEGRDLAGAQHVASVRRHIEALSRKAYHAQEIRSADYVVMFMPIEGALAEAMRLGGDLAGFAADKGVMIATPTTLMMALRTAESVWAMERRNTNAEAIAARAGKLYDKMAGFVDTMARVSAALDRARAEQDRAMGQLSQGGGNVLRQFEALRELGARTGKRIAAPPDGTDIDADAEPDAAPDADPDDQDAPARLIAAPGPNWVEA